MSNKPQTTIDDIISSIKIGISTWTGWEWNQDFADEDGERHVIESSIEIDDLPDETSRNAATTYDKECTADAAQAKEDAENAIQMLEQQDLSAALQSLEAAESIESSYGDSPSYGPPLRLLEKRIEEDEELVDHVRDDITTSLSGKFEDYNNCELGSDIFQDRFGPEAQCNHYSYGAALLLFVSDVPEYLWERIFTPDEKESIEADTETSI